MDDYLVEFEVSSNGELLPYGGMPINGSILAWKDGEDLEQARGRLGFTETFYELGNPAGDRIRIFRSKAGCIFALNTVKAGLNIYCANIMQALDLAVRYTPLVRAGGECDAQAPLVSKRRSGHAA